MVTACHSVKSDNSILEAPIRTLTGGTTTLRINIPASFPHHPPSLSITIYVDHPWIDNIGRVRSPLLKSWGDNEEEVTLAKVVLEVVDGLQRASQGGSPPRRPTPSKTPPSMTNTSNASPYQQQQRIAGNGLRTTTPFDTTTNTSSGLVRLPPPPQTFTFLSSLSTEELSAALTNEEAYAKLLERAFLEYDVVETAMEQVKAECIALANANIEKGDSLKEAQHQINVVRESDYVPFKSVFEPKAQRQAVVMEKLGPDVLIGMVDEAKDEVDEEWKMFRRKLLTGKLTVQEFVYGGKELAVLKCNKVKPVVFMHCYHFSCAYCGHK